MTLLFLKNGIEQHEIKPDSGSQRIKHELLPVLNGVYPVLAIVLLSAAGGAQVVIYRQAEAGEQGIIKKNFYEMALCRLIASRGDFPFPVYSEWLRTYPP